MINRSKRKGIILAGGSGSRLYPITICTSKQLLPVYDKPMIYYPLSVLMLSGITEIAVITTDVEQSQFQRLLGDGSQWGITIQYIVQPSPDGLAQAYILAEDYLDGSPSAMILGDNIFFGHKLQDLLGEADTKEFGGSVFGYRVSSPEDYGVVKFGDRNQPLEIVEKPANPPSNIAVTGLYYLDNRAPEFAKTIKPSARNELEITDLLAIYLEEGSLSLKLMGRGFAWLDSGTHDNLLEAGTFVKTLTQRQGQQVGSPDEIALRMGFIGKDKLRKRADIFAKNEYGKYLLGLLEEPT